MLNWAVNLSRVNKQLIMLLIDSLVLISILLASFSIRLGYWYFPSSDLIWVMLGAPIIAMPIFVYFGLYRAVIRYIGPQAIRVVVQAVSLYALVWGIVGFMAAVDGIPRSVILINWGLALLVIVGLRLVAQALFNGKSNDNKQRVLVYGAGDAGIQLVSALEHSSEYHPVGLIDDSTELQGNQIRGLKVFSIDDIERIIPQLGVNEVLVAMPSASRIKRAEIINLLEPYPVSVRLLPGIAELAQGKISIADLREVGIKELLGRDTVEANKALLGKNITNKVVVVTGAGGSIGSELCRQIVSLNPKLLILYDMSELALYTIDQELSNRGLDIYPILGSVNNKIRLTNVFKHFGVETIYHAAAYKHVPMVEFNNTEGVSNNVFGTLSCAQVAIDTGVETFVLISTDKAVRPTNTMGATKRTAELVLQALSAEKNSTQFSIVRFGNVLGSSGSVIPLFKRQIKAGGPVTVTDKNMVRYFMTISEAVELVIQAGSMGVGCEVFVLDMGKPVRIDELAKKMIHLSGLEIKDEQHPKGDIEIKYTGLRLGEKLYEELLIGGNVRETDNPLIMRAEEDRLDWRELSPILSDLQDAINNCDQAKLRDLLMQVVPEFTPQCEISDVLYTRVSLNNSATF